jgi:hypothetical protein
MQKPLLLPIPEREADAIRERGKRMSAQYEEGKRQISDMAQRGAAGVSKTHGVDITILDWEGQTGDDHLRIKVGKHARRYRFTEEAIEDYPGDQDRRHEVEQEFRVWLEMEAKQTQPPPP